MTALARRLAVVVPLCLAITGCVSDAPAIGVSSTTMGAAPYTRGDLSSLTYRAVDLILASTPRLAVNTPLVVASVSDVRNVDTTSALGNIVADMIRTRAVQDGYVVAEIRLRNAVSFRHGEGEFARPPRDHAAA